MDDRANAERADGAASHNGLSGRARSVAQAHTVFGGVHMYDSSSPQRDQRSFRGVRAANSLAVIAIVLSLTSVSLTLRRVTLPAPGMSMPSSHLPRDAGEGDLLGITEIAIPEHREDGRQDYLLEMPEIAKVYSFQAYQCDGRLYHQALVGALKLQKKPANIASVARTYGDKLAAVAWRSSAFSKYERPQPTSRSPFGGGSTYHGVQFQGTMPLGADARCGVDAVMIGVLALDCGDSYCLYVVLIGTTCQAPGPQLQAAQDVRHILDSIGISP
jgi:hypothetical protein